MAIKVKTGVVASSPFHEAHLVAAENLLVARVEKAPKEIQTRKLHALQLGVHFACRTEADSRTLMEVHQQGLHEARLRLIEEGLDLPAANSDGSRYHVPSGKNARSIQRDLRLAPTLLGVHGWEGTQSLIPAIDLFGSSEFGEETNRWSILSAAIEQAEVWPLPNNGSIPTS